MTPFRSIIEMIDTLHTEEDCREYLEPATITPKYPLGAIWVGIFIMRQHPIF